MIRVGAYENQTKIYTDESGKIVGLFPDVLNYIAQKEGWALKYVHGTWSQCLERLEKNEIELMPDVAFSEKRALKYNFNNETFLVNWATVYTGKNQIIESPVDFNGKKIAVMKGSIHTEGENGIKKHWLLNLILTVPLSRLAAIKRFLNSYPGMKLMLELLTGFSALCLLKSMK